MSICCVCGNSYDKDFTITVKQKHYDFDCFECAIHRLAPTCAHCGCRIIGHGVESNNTYYCCVHCAKESGVKTLKDRA